MNMSFATQKEGQIYVIEALEFEKPKTRQMVEMLEQLELSGRKVLVLTSEHRPEVYLSARNIPRVEVMTYGEASALDLMWADALVVEEAAMGQALTNGKHESNGKPAKNGKRKPR